eukprot:CAMPEP_0176451306 /NCGR_PEP_ID=MMETSP0127-20121128/27749_1 /TAXON_ID=938130 /ORGANISM="Platyophrya macrostoma, Strain WH" /LENGTH=179 /DNA_ID=CAMNT_0017839319 /DNA_START=197 /DNA_END=737 /DNA_ORIENTATION=+
MPIKYLKLNKTGGLELEVVERKFADDPTDERSASGSTSTIKKRQSRAAELSQQLVHAFKEAPKESEGENDFLYNDVSANHYEEFEVTKIIPVAEDRIEYMGLKEKISSFFFSEFATKHPERLLRDIKEARIKKDNIFCIDVKVEGGRIKSIEYEAPEKRVAQQICAKIRYIKTLEQKIH